MPIYKLRILHFGLLVVNTLLQALKLNEYVQNNKDMISKLVSNI